MSVVVTEEVPGLKPMQVISQDSIPGDPSPSAGSTFPFLHAELTSDFNEPIRKLNKFNRGQPQSLGIVEIMIGLVNIVFGFIFSFPLTYANGTPFWTSAMYIISGSLCIIADKNPGVIIAALTGNIVTAVISGSTIYIYLFDSSFRFSYFYKISDCQKLIDLLMSTENGIKVVLLVSAVLEFCVSTYIGAFGLKAVCGIKSKCVVKPCFEEARPLQVPSAQTV
ncbi:membrane-spanning 4-domains subfamily A member 4A-like [Erpetoichthys calabaricus]|uniref:membrane-spanning 4-domains subfamily A member 4A-like n=1 Tax=Erpetoichthys calabaricus TaxID=27687 RepID=UPI00109F8A1D|nr:membrane-spanning 4-domains subfamily A member 4A-like [Erpetoichthys calabaricus]XP_051778429.1 membrane-spanning 4-domains subfamily A member 4A-like [Erpetoichthys calabaricus]